MEEYNLTFSSSKKKLPKWYIKDDTNEVIYDYADEIKRKLQL